jgi:hypothetical protein
LLALGLGACAKHGKYADAAPPTMADYAATPTGMPDGSEARVVEAMDAPALAEPALEREVAAGGWASRRAARRAERDADAGGDLASPPPGPSTPMNKPEEPPTSGGGGQPALEESRKDIGGRMVIYTAMMQVSVFDLEEAVAKAEALPEKYGGYVQSIQAGTVVLKIPARKLRAVMNELGDFGVVEQRSLSADDVSAEYTDIESRIRALEATHKQLIELLGKARTVDEALHVRQSLDAISPELEVLKGRMRQLDNLIAFSTLTLQMFERGPNQPLPSSNDPFPWVDQLGVEASEWK